MRLDRFLRTTLNETAVRNLIPQTGSHLRCIGAAHFEEETGIFSRKFYQKIFHIIDTMIKIGLKSTVKI